MTTSRGERLRRARRLRHLTRDQLAEITGVSSRTIGRIETGESAGANSIEILEHELAPELARMSGAQNAEHATRATVPLGEATDLDLVTTLAQRLSDQARRIAELEAELRRRDDDEAGEADEDGDQPVRPGPPGGVPMHFKAADAPSAIRRNGGPDTDANAALGSQ